MRRPECFLCPRPAKWALALLEGPTRRSCAHHLNQALTELNERSSFTLLSMTVSQIVHERNPHG